MLEFTSLNFSYENPYVPGCKVNVLVTYVNLPPSETTLFPLMVIVLPSEIHVIPLLVTVFSVKFNSCAPVVLSYSVQPCISIPGYILARLPCATAGLPVTVFLYTPAPNIRRLASNTFMPTPPIPRMPYSLLQWSTHNACLVPPQYRSERFPAGKELWPCPRNRS